MKSDAPRTIEQTHADMRETATVWREQAGVLRRRAARAGDEGARKEGLARAAWFEARAAILAGVEPVTYLPLPAYPRELATPSDRAAQVDELRRLLVEVLALVDVLEVGDLHAFARYLERKANGHGSPVVRIAPELLEQLAGAALDVAIALGAHADGDFAPYDVPIVGDEG